MKRRILMRVSAVMLLILSGFSMGASAANCEDAVDKICKAYGSMIRAVVECDNINDFDAISIDDAIMEDLNEIDDGCKDYVLTDLNRAQLDGAFNSFVAAMCQKLYEFTGGILSYSDIEKEMSPMTDKHRKIVNNSRTLEDYINGINHF